MTRFIITASDGSALATASGEIPVWDAHEVEYVDHVQARFRPRRIHSISFYDEDGSSFMYVPPSIPTGLLASVGWAVSRWWRCKQ
jgi:hypothetical protein